VENLDRAKKGYVAVEDLTFYFNTMLDGKFRNRDMMMLFNRLGKDVASKNKPKFK